jgi:hypothetical protein
MDVELTVNADEVVDFGFNPATARPIIEVQAEAHRIDSESAALTDVVARRAMRELPLNGLASLDLVGRGRHSHVPYAYRKSCLADWLPIP